MPANGGGGSQGHKGKSRTSLQEAIVDAATNAQGAAGQTFRVEIEVKLGNPRVDEYRVTLRP